MRHLTYKVMLHKEEEGGYTVIVPALPGCITWGETIEQSMLMAREAIDGYIATLRDMGERWMNPCASGYFLSIKPIFAICRKILSL